MTSADQFYDILPILRDLERMGWRAIEANHGMHHPSPAWKLCKEAQDRLKHLNLDDFETLFRLRLSGTKRLWGIRTRNLFRVLWWDPNHMVYPTEK